MLVNALGGTYLRVDTIEQTLRDSELLVGAVHDAGYRIAYAVAADNLRHGGTVVADSVNPLRVSRDAWRDVAICTGARVVEVEVICSNADEHRRRIESRHADIPRLPLPSWQEVCSREYEAWDRPRIIVDTADSSPEQSFRMLRSNQFPR